MQTKPVLTLEDVKKIAAASEAEAKANNWAVTISIVDDGGHLLWLQRLDGAAPISASIAPAKAKTAALGRRESKSYEDVINDDEALEAVVRKATIGVWHASCSCRMGRVDDPMAVVDTEGRVKGIQGLRVVDASIFPVVPCANTNFPVLMSAEKIAAAMMR